jgi:hypothetical protein
MSGTTADKAEHVRRKNVSRILAGLAVLALVILLLVWGFSVMQWTVLTTNNALSNAVTNSEVQIETFQYSIPQGVEHDYTIGLGFYTPSRPECVPYSAYYPTRCLNLPVSNSSTTIDDYVLFSLSLPNSTTPSSAIWVWYSGPQGNFTQNGCIPIGFTVECGLNPGVFTTWSKFFPVSVQGNYTMHIMGTSCQEPNCTSPNAVGSGAIAVSSVFYNRPYYNAGLATVIVAGVAIAAAIVYLAITSYRLVNHRRKTRPPARASRPSSPIVD